MKWSRWARSGLPAVLLAGCLSLAAISAEAAQVRLKPKRHAGTERVLIGKKTSLYHRASQAKPIEFDVTGPARLKILARSLPPGAGQRRVHLRFDLDAAEAGGLELYSTLSAQATLSDGRKVGTLRRGALEVPKGRHRVRIYTEDPTSVAICRIFRSKQEKTQTTWVTYAPETFERAVRMRTGDRDQTWYRITPESPIGMTIHGPLRLKISTRIDFDLNAGPSQSYLMLVEKDKEGWKSFALRSSPSHTVASPELPEIAPGMKRDFLLQVPRGTHQITLRLNGTTAPGASVRIHVPKSQVRAKPGS